MSPSAIDRVFGRGRLRMVTGDHVEVFREESLPGERRRYTKRFLATPAGDFRQWTEREWRILARLVGHGIGPVPDVVQFDRGAGGRQALVQTYDAGVTVDHWTTLLPVCRDGAVLPHVFADCAHWWALARHCLVALDAIHELHLVHLDLKADNVCIPVGPADFDPHVAGARLVPDFARIALIDFAFSLVSGEPLASALPIARQTEYDYQSPRLLQALDAGSRGDLQPTRILDWRCDLFSLAAMLRRYLPEPGSVGESGWTPLRQLEARALLRRLFELHDDELPATRPHAVLIAGADAMLAEPELAHSLARGWTLAEQVAPEHEELATPITRIALPVTPRAEADLITIDRSDVERRSAAFGAVDAAAAAPRRWPRRVAAGAALVAVAALSVPLLGEAWRALAGAGTAPSVGDRVATLSPAAEAKAPPAKAKLAPAQAAVATPREPTSAEPSAAPASTRGPVSPTPSPDAAPPVAAPQQAPTAPAPTRATVALADPPTRQGALPPRIRVAVAAKPRPHGASHAQLASAATTRGAKPSRPSPFPVVARASARPAVHAAVYLPPAVGLAPSPGWNRAALAAQSLPSASSSPPVAAPPVAADDSTANPAPVDYGARAAELLTMQLPRLAQRAERLVLRVLFTAANADENGLEDDDVRRAASEIRLAPDDPQLVARPIGRDARAMHDVALAALRRGDVAEAVALQTRAFGANPVDPEIVGQLAALRLRQSPAQPEAARRLALHALTLHDWKHPSGRIEDWHTFAVASALTGHERDARNAWLVSLALAGASDRQCRAAIDAYAVYGEPLRAPVEAMLYRANASTRAQRSRLCEWPPHWSASAQSR